MRFMPFVLSLSIALSACAASLTPDQAVQAVAPSACQGWNDAERVLGPKIPDMSETEHKLFLMGFATLTGGTPLAKTNKGLCRLPWESVTAANFVNAAVESTLAQLAPMLAKYNRK